MYLVLPVITIESQLMSNGLIESMANTAECKAFQTLPGDTESLLDANEGYLTIELLPVALEGCDSQWAAIHSYPSYF